MPVSKPLGGGLHEVRTKLSDSRISRVIFYIEKKGRMVLLHGLIKKTRKLPHQELELARENRSNHERGIEVKKDHTGSAFDSFLAEENLLEEAEAVALKRVIAWQLKTAMNTKHVSKTQLAQQLHTSRSQVNRLLDPAYVGVSIGRVAQAARAALGSAFASK